MQEKEEDKQVCESPLVPSFETIFKPLQLDDAI